MTIVPPQFRLDFTEFANTTNYPDSMVQFWLNFSYNLLNSIRFGNMLDTAAELYTAHNCVLEFQNNRSAARGGAPGLQKGPISSESVGPASQSYDTGAASENPYGNLNLTNYGTRLAALIRMFGAGPVQIC